MPKTVFLQLAQRRECVFFIWDAFFRKNTISFCLDLFVCLMLGFTDEAECLLRGNELVIRPARRPDGGEFSEDILADLIREGYSGEDLLSAFTERMGKYRQAIDAMRDAAYDAANGVGEYDSYEDVFGSEDEND